MPKISPNPLGTDLGRPGQMVAIYEDPYTCQRLEGYAMLEKKTSDDSNPAVERWSVHFPGDSTVSRLVNRNYTK